MTETVVAPTWVTKARVPSCVIAMPVGPSPVSSAVSIVFDARSTKSSVVGPVGIVAPPTSTAAPTTLKNRSRLTKAVELAVLARVSPCSFGTLACRP
jgi:hypothetical protein